MSNHTPGPWWTDGIYREDEMGVSVIAARTDCGPLPGNPTRGQVAFVTMILAEYAQEASANAHLIAAAPDLLSALKLTAGNIRNAMVGIPEPALEPYREWLRVVEEAIGKAEG